jgi:hypothetical protein
MRLGALALLLLLTSVNCTSSGGSPSGCEVGGVHFQEGQTYCCGNDGSPAPEGNSCACSHGAIETDAIFCNSEAGPRSNDSGGAESSAGD